MILGQGHYPAESEAQNTTSLQTAQTLDSFLYILFLCPVILRFQRQVQRPSGECSIWETPVRCQDLPGYRSPWPQSLFSTGDAPSTYSQSVLLEHPWFLEIHRDTFESSAQTNLWPEPSPFFLGTMGGGPSISQDSFLGCLLKKFDTNSIFRNLEKVKAYKNFLALSNF